jgi:hypothetical protein
VKPIPKKKMILNIPPTPPPPSPFKDEWKCGDFPPKKDICNKTSLFILFLIFVPNFTQKWIVRLRKKKP